MSKFTIGGVGEPPVADVGGQAVVVVHADRSADRAKLASAGPIRRLSWRRGSERTARVSGQRAVVSY